MLPVLISETNESELIIQDLALRLGLDLLMRGEEEKELQLADDQYYLVRGKKKSHLQIGLKGKQKPILCNFTDWSNNKKKSNLLRCMKGLPSDCSVVDATAGFGRDALELATVSDSVVLIERVLWGEQHNYCMPGDIFKSGKRSMFGGNFVYTSDDRFPSEAPIKVFDRLEY